LVEIFELLNADSAGHQTQDNLRLLRVFRLARLLRLLKVFRLGEALKTIEYVTGFDLRERVVVLYTVIGVIAYTHLVACTFYEISLISGRHYGRSWVSTYEESIDGAEPIERYIVSLLWAVGIVTGLNSDVLPENPAERVVSAVLYIAGALLFAFIVAVVTQQRLSYVNDPLHMRMSEVSNFSRFHRLPRGLNEKLTDFFQSMYSNTSVVRDEEILSKMTPTLQDQVRASARALCQPRARVARRRCSCLRNARAAACSYAGRDRLRKRGRSLRPVLMC
jgi:potassium voltage-gated channel Eag-related subfamily H protein 2/potassium voltage-gated channel Eag-related subfamily H protein 7